MSRVFAHSLLILFTLLTAPAFAGGEEDTRLNRFFEQAFSRELALSPIRQSRMGIRDGQAGWDDVSEAAEAAEQARLEGDLEALKSFDFNVLREISKQNYRFFDYITRRDIESLRWRGYGYVVSQMGGMHTRIPTILMNNHAISTLYDAEAYISRLHSVRTLLGQVVKRLELQEKKGIRPPKFVYDLVIDPSRKIITGQPFDEEADSPLWADFKAKVAALDVAEDVRRDLLTRANAALVGDFLDGYQALIAHLEGSKQKAGTEDGVWRLEEGAAYYRSRLRHYTTLDLDADAVHLTGLDAVAHIHAQMRDIAQAVGFEGNLSSFFDHMRTSPAFYYPDTADGRAAYMARTDELLAGIKAREHEIFGRLPRAEVVARAIPAWREKSAPKAHYSGPPMDFSRPGIFYVNLYDMKAQPAYQLPVLLYHEAIPGHHIETALAYELPALPMFRKYASIAAFSEGWSLYSEELAKEMGLYPSPYDDFGRLSMALMRAVRLVVDTGIHAKGWSREEAITYMDANMPSSHYDNQREVERYIVLPGQATSYYIGMLKILELRDEARATMGTRFDLRAFHDAVLGSGPLPLPMLEEEIHRRSDQGEGS
ncbi:DUF885 domain-containing protein [Kordiimonas aestuarii]|uniref:DUF885 domain-containing protein n=1 Tax=Kordiimonas aestuarii TaxID=1005925 RepID=UPI0021CE565C|nr:DUF885 domain-containing protein [Kordiimonas aestuarii]